MHHKFLPLLLLCLFMNSTSFAQDNPVVVSGTLRNNAEAYFDRYYPPALNSGDVLYVRTDVLSGDLQGRVNLLYLLLVFHLQTLESVFLQICFQIQLIHFVLLI